MKTNLPLCTLTMLVSLICQTSNSGAEESQSMATSRLVNLASSSRSTTELGESHGPVLNRDEIHTLNAISARMESMINLTDLRHTRVWPHGVRDEEGRIGLFIQCAYPVIAPLARPETDTQMAWVIQVLTAAVKYSEKSHVTIHHLGFTAASESGSGRWYWDLDMQVARRIHRHLYSGSITPEEAITQIVRSWTLVKDG